MQTDQSFTSKCPENEEQMMEHNAAAATADYYVFVIENLSSYHNKKKR